MHSDNWGKTLLSRPLKELDNLVSPQCADRHVFAIKVALKDNLLSAGIVGLFHLLQERRTLVAAHCDPALLSINQRLALHACQPDLVICQWPLQHLDHLVGVSFPDQLAFADLELVSDGNRPHDNEVLLQQGEELSPPDATDLNVPAEQPRVLWLEGQAVQRLQVPYEGGLLDAVLALLQELGKEVLGREAPPLHLPAQGRSCLGVPSVHNGLTGVEGGLHGAGALTLHDARLALHLHQLTLSLQHRALDHLAYLA
mmetsp:Transcript_125561/g.349556  ORF Transcript_125561/g.349556 Transcript_125561/m.349556 type:complete len:256 (-) Transcript_125561:3540-4307(-)